MTYFIQISLAFIFLLAVYKLVLNPLQWFQFNRIYLLVIPIFLYLGISTINLYHSTSILPPQLTEFNLVEEDVVPVEAIGRVISPQNNHDFLGYLTWAIIFVSFVKLLKTLAHFGVMMIERNRVPEHKGYRILIDSSQNPFSFFNLIVIRSLEDEAILAHEKVHVNQWHSMDIIAVELLKSIFWFHPVMYWYAKEIRLNHEFLADEGGIKQLGMDSYSKVFFKEIHSFKLNPMVNPFAFKDFKKRISNFETKTITMNKKIMIGLITVVALGLGTMFTAFKYQPNKQYVLVVDAAHGGKDPGAIVDGISEKAIVSDLAQIIKSKSIQTSVEVVLLRNDDEFISLFDRKAKIKTIQPDAYVSLHANQSDDVTKSGVEVYCGNNMPALFSTNLSMKIAEEIGESVVINKTANFMMLNDMETAGALIEIGFLSNEKDRANLLNTDYLEQLASAILETVEHPVEKENQ